ncbi:MAG: hypothetical protein EXS60_01325 [Candidatus Pacebacteria bacterium]|nr:hypothetical protein [Candidatus Paceibacterota bacterium]
MKNIKQYLVEEIINKIVAKEWEIQESDQELALLGANLRVANKTLGMKDIKEHLKEDFKYSAQALRGGMVTQKQQKNAELKKIWRCSSIGRP